MFGFKKKTKSKRSPRRSTGSKAAKELAECKEELAEARQQNRLKDAEIQSLKDRLTVQEETINVLRDCLESRQVTAQVHTAEGKILLDDLGNRKAETNGVPPLR